MAIPAAIVAVRHLRQRLTDVIDMRHFGNQTQRNYIRDVGRFTTLLGRPPGTSTAEEAQCFQMEQSDLCMLAPTMYTIVAALRFFFTQTLETAWSRRASCWWS